MVGKFICQIFITIVLFATIKLYAEESETKEQNPFSHSIFIDTYYTKANNKPPDNQRSYTTQAVNTEAFSLNYGLAQTSYQKENFRAFLGVQTGTYVEFNYVAEPQLLKNIYEAYGGYQVAKDLWLDIGIFPSHIGIENAISRDNFNYTRSLMAENSPYYESGAKLSYKLNEKISLTLLLLNGWQMIKDNNRDKSWGTQITYQFSKRVTFNWSTYIGNDAEDSERRRMRYFNHLSAIFGLTKKLEAMMAFDIGQEKKPYYSPYDRWLNMDYNIFRKTSDNAYYHWSAWSFLLRYTFNPKWKLGGRLESYLDKSQVIITTDTVNGFQVHGGSLNIDYQPLENLLFRLEARAFQSVDNIYPNNNVFKRDERFAVASMSIWF